MWCMLLGAIELELASAPLNGSLSKKKNLQLSNMIYNVVINLGALTPFWDSAEGSARKSLAADDFHCRAVCCPVVKDCLIQPFKRCELGALIIQRS